MLFLSFKRDQNSRDAVANVQVQFARIESHCEPFLLLQVQISCRIKSIVHPTCSLFAVLQLLRLVDLTKWRICPLRCSISACVLQLEGHPHFTSV